MKIRQLEKLFVVVLAVLCCGLGVQLRLSLKENGKGTVVYKKKVTTEEPAPLPEAYDLRQKQKEPEVKNQGTLGTCWAVAASSALESVLRPQEKLIFSADHMSLLNSFSREQNDGGDYTMVMAYLAGWQGPVLEKDDPYGDGVSDTSLSAVKHVQEMQILGEKDYTAIKKAVYRYGAVQSSILYGYGKCIFIFCILQPAEYVISLSRREKGKS